ncbi:MAG: hypothetical protein M1838_003729 [Thelocarpon superellum]|nr:MAG: hypothetical protein M1838_003729 [Thelocarpon superellum]
MERDVEKEAADVQIRQHAVTPTPPREIPSPARTASLDPSSESSTTPSLLEKSLAANVASADADEHGTPLLPAKRHRSRLARYLDHNFFSYYRKTFTIVFAANLIAFIVMVSTQRSTRDLMTTVQIAVSANLMVALLFRQENFVNLWYEIFTSVPHGLPLWLRTRCAKVFHYGGAHSGCGVAAVTWHLLYTALATKEFVETRQNDARSSVITSWILVTMFLAMVIAAHPRLRVRYHDRFEYTHRFAGWAALATFWTHLILNAAADGRAKGLSLGMDLVQSVNFWFLLVSTGCSVLSWARLRRRTVTPERLSDHAIRLHFGYMPMKPFYGLKVSNRPLLEWHAFATIPDTDEQGGTKGFSVVVSNAGDWTKNTIQHQPQKLWVRGYPMHGLLYTSKLFKRIIVVATGSGIGPTLSLMKANITPRRILWSTPHPETTYGPTIMKTVLEADPNAVIWNTRTQGRPDMVTMTYRLFREYDAEAVFIISNPKLTRKVVYGMESRGIAAYGAIFDS